MVQQKGNTKNTADIIKKSLKKKVLKLQKEMFQILKSMNWINDYDLMIFGCSTWSFGEEEFEMQSGFKPFYKEMSKHTFENKKIGVFGDIISIDTSCFNI